MYYFLKIVWSKNSLISGLITEKNLIFFFFFEYRYWYERLKFLTIFDNFPGGFSKLTCSFSFSIVRSESLQETEVSVRISRQKRENYWRSWLQARKLDTTSNK